MITSQNASSEEQVKNSGHAPLPLQLKGGGVQNFRKVFAGEVRNFYFGGGVNFLGGGRVVT